MAIACLGWGSLIWKRGNLPVGDWYGDGPSLPLEFARLSRDGRVTLVITDAAPSIEVLWAEISAPTLENGIALLAEREGCPAHRIGHWPRKEGRLSSHENAIASWAQAKGLKGVVWTALPPNWNKVEDLGPTADQILEHLETLDDAAHAEALGYIFKAPPQIQTPLRPHLERVLRPRSGSTTDGPSI